MFVLLIYFKTGYHYSLFQCFIFVTYQFEKYFHFLYYLQTILNFNSLNINFLINLLNSNSFKIFKFIQFQYFRNLYFQKSPLYFHYFKYFIYLYFHIDLKIIHFILHQNLIDSGYSFYWRSSVWKNELLIYLISVLQNHQISFIYLFKNFQFHIKAQIFNYLIYLFLQIS